MKLLLAQFDHYRSRAALVVVGMTALCTSLAALLILFVNVNFAKTELFSEMESLAKILSVNLAISVAFDDPNDAKEILSNLKLHRSIAQACVYRHDGSLLVQAITNEQAIQCLPQTGGVENVISKMLISVPILQNEKRLGSLTLNISDERISNFRQHIIWPSIGIILGFILLVAVPFAVVVQRRISKPVKQLVTDAQSLLPNLRHNPNDLGAALQIIELAKQRLLELSELNKWSLYKTDRIVENFQMSYATIKDNLQTTHNISSTNESIAQHEEFNVELAKELFSVSRTEIEKSQEYVGRLERLLTYHELYLGTAPIDGHLQKIIHEVFDDYFGKFLNKNITLKLDVTAGQTIKLFVDPFRSFIYTYFMFCEALADQHARVRIEFSMHRIGDSQKTVLCTLNAISSSPLLTILPEINFSDQTDTDLRDTCELEDKIKSVVERMKFFANLNTRYEPEMSIAFNVNNILIHFHIDEQ